jgi:hypothetical protein
VRPEQIERHKRRATRRRELRRVPRHHVRELGPRHGVCRGADAREHHDARQSTLIQKGDGQVAHAGGDQLDPGEVTSITTWVTECAQNN